MNTNILNTFNNPNLRFGFDGFYSKFFSIAGNSMGYFGLKCEEPKGDPKGSHLDFSFHHILTDLGSVIAKLKTFGLSLKTNSQKLGTYQSPLLQFIYKTMYATLLCPQFLESDDYKIIIDQAYAFVRAAFNSQDIEQIRPLLQSIKSINEKTPIVIALKKYEHKYSDIIYYALWYSSKKTQPKSERAIPLEEILKHPEEINNIDIDEILTHTIKTIASIVNKTYKTKNNKKINKNTVVQPSDSSEVLITYVCFPNVQEQCTTLSNLYTEIISNPKLSFNEHIDCTRPVRAFFDIEPVKNSEGSWKTPINEIVEQLTSILLKHTSGQGLQAERILLKSSEGDSEYDNYKYRLYFNIATTTNFLKAISQRLPDNLRDFIDVSKYTS